jgi:hypothetical protein
MIISGNNPITGCASAQAKATAPNPGILLMQLQEPAPELTGVAETLTITLYARAIETQCPEPILSDPQAVAIAQQLNYDFSKYEKGWISQLGCVIRARAYDGQRPAL